MAFVMRPSAATKIWPLNRWSFSTWASKHAVIFVSSARFAFATSAGGDANLSESSGSRNAVRAPPLGPAAIGTPAAAIGVWPVSTSATPRPPLTTTSAATTRPTGSHGKRFGAGAACARCVYATMGGSVALACATVARSLRCGCGCG